MVFFAWGSETKARRTGKGRFPCPTCRSEQSYELFTVSREVQVYFVRAGAPEQLGQYLVCRQCKTQFAPELFAQAEGATRGVMQEATWDCPKCKNVNANTRYSCLKCGQSLV